jgi:sulfhydrogenase subunit alpha
MTHRSAASRTVRVDQLARVEGEGALHLDVVDGAVADVRLRIFEPPRFFEAFLRGRAHTEPPDITARICGICPVAYQMSACRAVEDACGVEVDGTAGALRRLLYCGEWIESHTLHVSMLHAPDFMGVPSAIELAELDRPTVERALRLKKAGNTILEVVGGRAIHPVNVKVGGFHRLPRPAELATLVPVLTEALGDAVAVAEWVSGFDFPDVSMDYRFVVADDPGHYPVLGEGFTIDAGSHGPAETFGCDEFSAEVVESQVEHSTALHAHLRSGDGYLVGPLARFAMASERLHPTAAEVARGIGLVAPVDNPFRSVMVRAVEVVHAVAVALEIIDSLAPADLAGPPSIEAPPPGAGTAVGHGITEAPRGLLYHRYSINPEGTITDAVIVPPTSQNQPTIEHDLWHVAEDMLAEFGDDLSDADLQHRCEVAIRNHDPCISCATHFLDMSVERRSSR